MQARHSWPGSDHGGAAAQRARVLECPAARREEDRGREKESRERKREVNVLTRNFLKIFHGNLKKFEHESCSKFKFLRLSFQAKLRLSNDLKVKKFEFKFK